MTEGEALWAGIVSDPGDAGFYALSDWLQDNGELESSILVKLRQDLLADGRERRAGFDRAAAEAEMFALLRAGVTPVTPRERLLVGKVPIDFAFVPPGAFLMGGTNAAADGGPVPRRVELTKGFFMETTPVTRAQYHGVVRPDLRPTRSATKTHPVANARWRDAREFCRRASAATGRVVRRPTEAEWEFACRAGTDAPTYAGADADREFQKNGPWCPYTRPVGDRTPNAWGCTTPSGTCGSGARTSTRRAGTPHRWTRSARRGATTGPAGERAPYPVPGADRLEPRRGPPDLAAPVARLPRRPRTRRRRTRVTTRGGSQPTPDP